MAGMLDPVMQIDFEKAWIGFSLPLEYLTTRASAAAREWMQIANGVARFTLTESFSTPQFIRVRDADKDSGGLLRRRWDRLRANPHPPCGHPLASDGRGTG